VCDSTKFSQDPKLCHAAQVRGLHTASSTPPAWPPPVTRSPAVTWLLLTTTLSCKDW
jgi:hypothetical protein